MSGIKYLIFDLDGTLIDSSDGVVEAVNYSLQLVGLPPRSPDEITPYIGYSLKVMYADFTNHPYEDLRCHFQTRAREVIVTSARKLHGVDQALHTLRQRGLRLSIASTKIRSHIEGIIGKFGWQQHFEVFAGGDEVTRVKPDPEILDLVLRRMQAEPAEAVMVGDTENDIKAAHALSMPSIAVRSPFGDPARLQLCQPTVTVDSISDVPDALASLTEPEVDA